MTRFPLMHRAYVSGAVRPRRPPGRAAGVTRPPSRLPAPAPSGHSEPPRSGRAALRPPPGRLLRRAGHRGRVRRPDATAAVTVLVAVGALRTWRSRPGALHADPGLVLQQPPLGRQPCAEPDQLATRADDAVTGHDQRQGG